MRIRNKWWEWELEYNKKNRRVISTGEGYIPEVFGSERADKQLVGSSSYEGDYQSKRGWLIKISETYIYTVELYHKCPFQLGIAQMSKPCV